MVGQRLKELRQEKGYSISELAGLAGVSKSYLSYIERDVQKNPSLHFLQKIALTLEIDVEDLLATSSDNNTNEIFLDDEWSSLIHKAIEEGMSKKDFKEFRDFLNYKKWKEIELKQGNCKGDKKNE